MMKAAFTLQTVEQAEDLFHVLAVSMASDLQTRELTMAIGWEGKHVLTVACRDVMSFGRVCRLVGGHIEASLWRASVERTERKV